jgi:hypothetical protein
MADNLNMPAGAATPKPAEASKVQPKKETVRISLPPKPAAKETVRLELPPKPAAKETVRLELPPRPAAGMAAAPPPAAGSAAPKPALPQSGPTISLVVPQVDDASKTVKIPNPAEMVTLQHTPPPAKATGPPKPAAPAKVGAPAAKVAATGVMPSDAADAATMVPGATGATAGAVTAASKASVVLPAASREKAAAKEKKEAAAAVPGKASLADKILATVALLGAIGALVSLLRHIM